MSEVSDNTNSKRPNILILMFDEQRYPSIYETARLKKWCKENLVTQELLKKNGMEFVNHYAGSTACSPSRTTLYTGQYPSLHGVTQTTGAAKGSFDPDFYWLDPNSVPTMGHYFRAAGYETFWKGKWHASDEDILIPGTHNAYASYSAKTGSPTKDGVALYENANRLDAYGFSGWVGPEPHGPSPRNSTSSARFGLTGRDEVYAADTVKLIQSLEKKASKGKDQTPWFIMCSLVNPHDIALYGVVTARQRTFHFQVDPSLPPIPPAPTTRESLDTKPTAHTSYRDTYPKALQPIVNNQFYRKLYYSLQKKVDQEMLKVFKTLQKSCFYEDTIVLFTSDHGELLEAHGGLYQKWYNMYEESIHVPFIIHSPKLFSKRTTSDMLTSHVDILPTLIGLAGLDVDVLQKKLTKTHTEVRPFVGRDLSRFVKGNVECPKIEEPLYFMTDDDFTKGLNQTTITESHMNQSFSRIILKQ